MEMELTNILGLAAGLGMFLYGMQILSNALQALAGSRLERTLEKLTNNRLKGLFLGTAITALIQSSSATTVMVVGFVNAGLLKLSQSVGVIMGANIGTTVTAQILRLGDLNGTSLLLTLLKPSSFGPIIILIGAAINLFSKDKKRQNIGSILLGLGLLFFGMYNMEQGLSPLGQMPEFQQMMLSFSSNPLLGLLVGILVTALIQSSSASIGILQALSATGLITFGSAVPIILGQNIGTCITVLLAGIGANRTAKKAGLIHLSFNVIGTTLWLIGIYSVNALVGLPFWNEAINRGTIADFHTLFNVSTTLILLPFSSLLLKLANALLREKGDKTDKLSLLDDRFLSAPAVAIEQCNKVIVDMGASAIQNYNDACALLQKFDSKLFKKLNEREESLDKTESALNNYLVKVTSRNLSDTENKTTSEILHTINDFERIGDYSVNLAEAAEELANREIHFSDSAKSELRRMVDAVSEILSVTMEAYSQNSTEIASHVEPLEEVIDLIKETLKTKHIDRLQNGRCSINSGLIFLELLNNFERIADHCSNIAVYVIQLHANSSRFDPHEHLREMHEGTTEEYKLYYKYYMDKYYAPIEQGL